MQGFYRDVGRNESVSEGYGPRAAPGEWLPLLLDAYIVVSQLARRFGLEVVIAGAGAYSLHVEADPTKDVDLVFSKPLPVSALPTILEELSRELRFRKWNVIGGRIQQGRSAEDWVIQLFVAVKPGRVVSVEVFNLLAVRPLSFFEVTEVEIESIKVKVLTLESWIASKLADPNGVDELNVRRLEKAVRRGINEAKLFEILMGLGMREVVSINARSAMRRTQDRRLIELLQMLV